MTYKEKMTRHLQAAEARNAEVDRFEDWADKRVEVTHKVDLARAKDSGNRESIKYQAMSKLLEGEPLYKNRASVRDYHVRMATMYGIAAILEPLDRP